MNQSPLSKKAFNRAQKYIPGGVNSPVRAYGSVGGTPPFIRSGKGSHVTDIDGRSYIDYVGSWGPLILGHARKEVVSAVHHAIDAGSSFGAPTEAETDLAEMITRAVPSIEMVRLVSSGTEACMSALRLARAYTKRDLVIKFEGCYHGHSDGLLAKAGSGAATLGVPTSPGVPESYASQTAVLPYNCLETVSAFCNLHKDKIAAIIVEPIAGNMGVVPPAPGYLQGLRSLCTEHGIVLVFDEVITGFRVSYGGAQKLFKIKPDLTILGKIIGGGLPLAAYGGRKEIMGYVSPAGPVYQAGTLSGNPAAVAAGIATLKILKEKNIYTQLEDLSAHLEQSILHIAEQTGTLLTINRVGSMMTLFFSGNQICNFNDALKTNLNTFQTYFWLMNEQGIYLAPSGFEASFVSVAHTKKDIEKTIKAVHSAFKKMAEL